MNRRGDRTASVNDLPRRRWQALIGATGMLAASGALAASESTDSLEVLEEVIVTAQKREQNLQKIPAAVTAVTAERLDELNAQKFEDYFRDVPGLMAMDQGNGRKDFSLRGVSSGQVNTTPATVDISTVSQYYDEIPTTASGFQMDARLVDIERVEILRGPQGTFYGEGALGGTIRLITRKPLLDSVAGALEGRLASTENGAASNGANAMLNLPLVTGKAALRLNAFYAEDGGYIDKINANDRGEILGINSRDINGSRSKGYRSVLLVEPSDAFSIQAQAAHFESDTESFGSYQTSLGDLRVSVCPPRASAPPPPGGGPGGGGPGGGGPGGGSPGGGGPVTNEPECEGTTFVGGETEADLYNLTLSGDFGWATLVSSSSYSETGTDLLQTTQDTSGSSLTEPALLQDLSGFTQELRLVSSPAWSARWDYVLGLYYQDKDTSYEFPPTSASIGSHVNEFNAKQTAAFADVGYMLSNHFQLRLGLRASDVRNSGDIFLYTEEAAPQRIHSSSKFTPVTGHSVLSYFINEQMLLYTSVAREFRNGTINDTSINYSFLSTLPGFTPIPATSDPDTTTNYEFGWKLSFPALRATVNGAAYHTDWEDMQVLSYATSDTSQSGNGGIPPGIAPAFVNAPRAKIDGFEIEAGMELLKGLHARLSWSLIDARLTEDFFQNLLNGSGTDRSLHARKGDRIPFVARSSGSASLIYRHPLFADFNGFAIVNAQYQGRRTTDFNEVLHCPPPIGSSAVPIPTYFEMDSYWTTGMQIGVENDLWRAALYADNLADSRADLFNRGDSVRITNRPRTIGLTLRRKFD